jgi:FlaA1/EpsC-like NDP-sugar epimerase
MHKLQELLENLKTWRRPILWALQIAVFAFSAVTAFLLRFDFTVPAMDLRYLAYAGPIWIMVKVAVFRAGNLDRGLWRYVSMADVHRVALGNLIGSVVSCVVIIAVAPPGFPRSIFVLDLMVCGLATFSLRLTARILQERPIAGWTERLAGRKTLIYGAGDAGIILLKEIRNNPKLLYRVIGFVDDEPEKQGLRVAGVPVLGEGEKVGSLVKEHAVKTILIAMPSATGAEMTRILGLCHGAGAECKTVPGLGEMIENHALVGQIREVAVEDLLGRTPVRLEENQIRSTIANKVVMVTGAAGSIGSELCRQIARFNPAGIVGFDNAESPLFEIEQEMRRTFPGVPFHPEIGSIQNRARLDEVLCHHRPLVVYHAAAFKHVPLMEAHVFEAIENNVFGTYNVAEAAADHGVEDLVMISSDKAVRPTNVMGTTKRIAELLLLTLQNGRTKFVAVRFGNVLGSNGSVIPIFKKQIAAGGPVTVTHPEMRRFFMTIPEACQLVLQAAAIGKGGQICVLDMGHPVKIVDLARNLILLSGLRPDEDIKIEFTGARPGEKMYEELSTLLEDTIPTVHEKIRIFVGNGMPDDDMLTWLETLREICDARDTGRLVLALKEMVPDYSPSTDLLKRVIRLLDEPRQTAFELLGEAGIGDGMRVKKAIRSGMPSFPLPESLAIAAARGQEKTINKLCN